MSCSGFVSCVHNIEKFLGRSSTFLDNTLNLNVIVFIFKNIQSVLVVQQIQASASIDFKKTDWYFLALEEIKKFSNKVLL